MSKPVTMVATGLKCDTPGCGFECEFSFGGEEVTHKQIEHARNRSCPACGASLLTDEDAASLHAAVETVERTNRSWISRAIDGFENAIGIITGHGKRNRTLRFRMDGSGKFEQIDEHGARYAMTVECALGATAVIGIGAIIAVLMHFL